jgi:hypothetical protein
VSGIQDRHELLGVIGDRHTHVMSVEIGILGQNFIARGYFL